MIDIPIWEKYTLSIDEAADYFGIGKKKLYSIIQENPGADFILKVGTHNRIKRKIFENYLNVATSV